MHEDSAMTERLLHFTLGPVQGFVAQARRTSDLWAGSLLLSWLAGQAMKAVVDNGGDILVPDVSRDRLFEAMTKDAGDYGPTVGSLPNRFKARVPEGFDPSLCRAAIDGAWRRLADAVWRRFVGPVADKGSQTQDIWRRQIDGFWETAWVVGLDPGGGDHAWLDRRKNWRSHRPPVQGGDHCMLMGDWQGLSGFVRSGERSKQDEFWRALKEHVDKESANRLQLDENERLCAMALIKRLLPHVAGDVLGWRPTLRWPSTPRLAAAGWLRHAWGAAREEAEAFAAVAARAKARLPEPPLDNDNRLSRVAGALLYRSGVENAGADELGGGADHEEMREKLLAAHRALTEKAGEPSPFYALLLMDGDRVGALLRQDDEGAVTKGLGDFSSQVEATVRRRGGSTVYAGGDDALALLPLEGALPAALDLRKAYRDALAVVPDATISAVVVFAHFHVPLRHALLEAHRLLDDVAKDGNGRDSLAVCVLAQSGVTREWASKWEAEGVSPPQVLVEAAEEIDAKTSGRFFYALREQYEDFVAGGVLDPDDLKRILLAEYRRSEPGARQVNEDAPKHVERLFMLAERHTAPHGPRAVDAPLVSMNGPLIARFLARETRRP
jgi:CRISPR-associated protein Cmr2